MILKWIAFSVAVITSTNLSAGNGIKHLLLRYEIVNLLLTHAQVRQLNAQELREITTAVGFL